MEKINSVQRKLRLARWGALSCLLLSSVFLPLAAWTGFCRPVAGITFLALGEALALMSGIFMAEAELLK